MGAQQEPQPTLLVTGHCGLIGSALAPALTSRGFTVRGLDIRTSAAGAGDVRDRDAVARAVTGCVGVIHLAAVSRVIDGEKDPDACWRTNVDGTRHVLEAAEASVVRPWVLYASSREVYGQPDTVPVPEDVPLKPVNIYGRSKVAAETLTQNADVLTAVVRFSNVYGTTTDHVDRVVPAFARQAALGHPLRVDGRGHTFDFTHLDDTVAGVLALVDRLMAGVSLPPIHLVTGAPTTLGELADLAVALAGTRSTIREAPPRSYDVSAFYGDPSRAADLLGWRAQVPLRDGLTQLIEAFRAEAVA